MRELAERFKALADETRLSMLALLLRERELCVCDFVGALAIGQSKASRHLQTLRHAGFLADRRDAVWVYYRIAPDLSDDLKAVLAAVRKVLAGERIESLHAALDRWLAEKNAGAICPNPGPPAAARSFNSVSSPKGDAP